MAHFKLVPTAGPRGCLEFDALSAATVLDLTLRYNLGETDVYQDGPYKCTISHGEGGVWTITQRKAAPGYDAKPSRPVTASVARPFNVKFLYSPFREAA